MKGTQPMNKQAILDKWNEYHLNIQYSRRELDDLLDKGIMDIETAEVEDTFIKLCFNDFGACLRVYQGSDLEYVGIRLMD